MNNKQTSDVKTSRRTLHIVDLIARKERVSLEELVNHLEMAESTVYRHLITLREQGYVLKHEDQYTLSLKFLTIGGQLRRRIPSYHMIKEKIDSLAEETGERAQFIVREHDERVYIYTETGENPVQTGAQVGGRGPLYASAAGKSILANLPEDVLNSLLSQISFEKTGPNTITNETSLRDNLEQVRSRGYAINREETTSGVHAIGTAIQVNGTIVGAISVSGPATRLKDDRLTAELPNVVLAASNELELHIEHRQPEPSDHLGP